MMSKQLADYLKNSDFGQRYYFGGVGAVTPPNAFEIARRLATLQESWLQFSVTFFSNDSR